MPAVSKAAPERGTGTDTFSPRRKSKAAPRSCGLLSCSDRKIHSQDRKPFHRTDRIPVRHESLPLPVSVHTWLHIPPPSDRGGQNPLYTPMPGTRPLRGTHRPGNRSDTPACRKGLLLHFTRSSAHLHTHAGDPALISEYRGSGMFPPVPGSGRSSSVPRSEDSSGKRRFSAG